MGNTNLTEQSAIVPVVKEIRTILDTARNNVARQVNNELLNTYWNIGRIICEYEQSDSARADYGKQTLRALSKELTKEFGKGFSVSNIQFMRRFYQTYQIQQTASVKLSWSHYCELLSISDTDNPSVLPSAIQLPLHKGALLLCTNFLFCIVQENLDFI